MKVSAIIPSAGSGRRMRSNIDKPFIKLGPKELIYYSIKALEDSSLISEIIIAVNPRSIEKTKSIIKRERFRKVKDVVKGAETRADSVFNALCAVSADSDIVVVHDSARPFITQELIERAVSSAKKYGACACCVPVKPTIKESESKGGFVIRTLKRQFLWEAQTPQAFGRYLLLDAYKKAGRNRRRFTDDASLVENIGRSVKIVMGSYSNIKITTPEDLAIVEILLKKKRA